MKLPDVLFVSVAGNGEDEYLSAHNEEVDAVRATDDETSADVAEYKLVQIRKRKIVTTVELV